VGRRTSGQEGASQRVHRGSKEDSAARYNHGEVQSGPQSQTDASGRAGTELRVCRHSTTGRSGTCRARAELVGSGRPGVVTFCRRKELDQLTLVEHRPSSLVPSSYRRGPPTGRGRDVLPSGGKQKRRVMAIVVPWGCAGRDRGSACVTWRERPSPRSPTPGRSRSCRAVRTRWVAWPFGAGVLATAVRADR